jgi:hypothetical protein
MSWLDIFFNTGYSTVQSSGSALPQQRALDFVGGTVVDDPTNARTIVTLPTPEPPQSTVTVTVPKGSLPATTILNPTQYGASTIILTGDVSSGIWTIQVPNTATWWLFDPTAITFGESEIKIEAASSSWVTVTENTPYWVYCNGSDQMFLILWTNGSAP